MDRVIYDANSGNVYYDPDGTGKANQVQFAHRETTGLSLTAKDFLLV